MVEPPVLDPALRSAVLVALEEYSADLDTSFAPGAFVSWARRNRPDVVAAIGEQRLSEFASHLISRAAQNQI